MTNRPEQAFLKALLIPYDENSPALFAIKDHWKRISKSYFEHLARSLGFDAANVFFIGSQSDGSSGTCHMQGMKGRFGIHLKASLTDGCTINRITGLGKAEVITLIQLTLEDMKEEPLTYIIRHVIVSGKEEA